MKEVRNLRVETRDVSDVAGVYSLPNAGRCTSLLEIHQEKMGGDLPGQIKFSAIAVFELERKRECLRVICFRLLLYYIRNRAFRIMGVYLS